MLNEFPQEIRVDEEDEILEAAEIDIGDLLADPLMDEVVNE